ncbi:MAG: hypothetical protein MPJ50_02660 [Pirellulales bacterium]|nr:hypothetical protein [Pirellulales bacterium]
MASRSLDEKLSLWQRFNLIMHVLMCKLCRGFLRDIRRIQQACQQLAKRINEDDCSPGSELSQEGRERIRTAVRDYTRKNDAGGREE